MIKRNPKVRPKPPSDRWYGCGCPCDAGECKHIRQSRIADTGGVLIVLVLAAAIGAFFAAQ